MAARRIKAAAANAPLLISMGCPAGIGPEIITRLFASDSGWQPDPEQPTVVVGDMERLRLAARITGHRRLALKPWQPGEPITPKTVPVLQVDSADLNKLAWGEPDASSGQAMACYVETAVSLILAGQAAALITCPISKFSLKAAGYRFAGHTEMLASLTGTKGVHMLMAGPRLKVALVTIHESLKAVPRLLTSERISDCILSTGASLKRDFALDHPRIAVAACNPHAGEQGLFGDEEFLVIQPAMSLAQSLMPEVELSGPWPPDTLFYQAMQGHFDAVVAMYHDQGLIPFKLVHFDDGVNVTLGLPLVRTSVDHGTAYDIAGKGLARADSLKAAVLMAQDIVRNRKRHANEL